MDPVDPGPQPDPPSTSVAAVDDAIEAWSVFEQFFVLSYRTSQGNPIVVTELSILSAAALGVAPDSVANDPGGFARLLHPDDRDRVLAEHWDAAVRGDEFLSEYRILGPNGTVLWIYDKAVPVTDAAGRTTLYGHCLDVTPRRQTGGRLSDAEEHLHWAVANVPGAVYRCACDEAGTIEYLSGQIEDLVGYPASDFIQNKVRSFDSVIHPDDLPHVIAEVNDALERSSPYSLQYRVIHLSGESRWVAEHGRPVFGPDGTPQWTAGVILDITRQKATNKSHELFERQMRRQEMYDALTGLPNRVLFRDSLARAISEAPEGDAGLAVFVMNLDRFKEVNDTLGREIGDGLLQEFGSRVQKVLREGDSVARLGRDEFAVLVHGAGRAEALEVVSRIRRATEEPVEAVGVAFGLEATIGISRWPEDGLDADSLLQCADAAMYVAKDNKLRHGFYDASVDARASARLGLVGELSRAISEAELVLHYQPKVAVKGGRVVGVEALVRWQDPGRGLVMPDEFIPVVRETSLIRAVTQCVLEEAARQWRMWSDEGRPLPVSVNVTKGDLADPAFPSEVATLLENWQMPASMLKLEVTESCITDDLARTEDVIERLGAMGLRFSVDDFATGRCSLTSLKRLPIDEIKIDRSFVSTMVARDEDEVIVRSTIELAHNLGLVVVAEGVEKRAVMDRLAELGCDTAQGFYMTRPVPAEELSIWLDQHPDSGVSLGNKRKFREDPFPEKLASA